MGFMRKALFLRTGVLGLAGVKANSNKERKARALEKQGADAETAARLVVLAAPLAREDVRALRRLLVLGLLRPVMHIRRRSPGATILGLALFFALGATTIGMVGPSTALASSAWSEPTTIDSTFMSPTTPTSDRIVGDWMVTYGNTTIVAMTYSGGVYTETATEPLEVVGSSCYLPPGTVIATFSGSGTRYSGQHGLWYSDCSFAESTSLELTLAGDTLTGVLGSGGEVVFTRVAPKPTQITVNSILPNLTCVDHRKFVIPVRQTKGGNGNVIAAQVYINHKLTKQVTGTNITSVRITKLPIKGRYVVKVMTLTTKNFEITLTRTYKGCKKGQRSDVKHKV